MISKTIFWALATLLIATIVSGKSTGRIVGGSSRSISDIPYQVSMQYTYSNKGKGPLNIPMIVNNLVSELIRPPRITHFCGGSIISEEFVLTACHCTQNLTPKDFIVVVSATFYDHGGKSIKVERIINNPNYNARTQDYDIALIKLAEELKYSKSIQPISLPKENEVVSPGTMGLVSGYGDQKQEIFLNIGKTQLNAVNVPFVKDSECNESYTQVGGITENMICAGPKEGGKDSCQGDSGGPLACPSEVGSGNHTICGVVSWGLGCAQPGYPGVYAKVQMFVPWIKKEAGI